MELVKYTIIDDTPIGAVGVAATAKGVCNISMSVKDEEDFRLRVEDSMGDAELVRDDEAVAPWAEQIREYLRGTRKTFEMEFDLRGVSPFQDKALRAAARIPFGEVRTYGEVALMAGSPGAARAVGTAMSRNPVPLLIPCHRVVAANRLLGGFSSGLHNKKTLLRHEGVALRGM